MSKNTLLPKFKLAADRPIYRQVAEQLRSHILSGDIPVGSRLPTVRELAAEVGTSVYSIQEAFVPLVREGLVDRSASRGTIVRGHKVQLTSVAFYFGGIMDSSDGFFYQALYTSILQHLQKRDIELHLIMDNRPRNMQQKPYPKLVQAIQKHEVQAVIAAKLYQDNVNWLSELEVPLAMMTSVEHPKNVGVDGRRVFYGAGELLKQRGAKTVALIHPHIEKADVFLAEAAEKLGLEVLKVLPEGRLVDPTLNHAEMGYHAFKQIWARERKPDGLFLYPDSCVQGAAMAIKEMGVRVPDDLKIVIHRNKGVHMFCPMTVDEVVSDVEELTLEFVRMLDRQMKGEEVSRVRTEPTMNLKY